MKTAFVGAASIVLVLASPAWAQFAPAAGSATTPPPGPNVSGAGTGLSAPSTINPATPSGAASPYALPTPSVPTALPPQPVMPSTPAAAGTLSPLTVPTVPQRLPRQGRQPR